MPDKNRLYFGDNLAWLRDHGCFPNECVDLVYLDPPWNSNADYNLIFTEPGGEQSQAQVETFDDTWHWDRPATAEAISELGHTRPDIIDLIHWIASRGDSASKSMAAYLSMMAPRLVELRRILKPTGSLYLHCDPTASHYIKLLLDTIFGTVNFRNEIVWRRTSKHNSTRTFGSIHDVILFHSKSNRYEFNIVTRPYMKGHVESRYSPDAEGRHRFTSGGNVLTGAGVTAGDSGEPWRGFDPSAKGRHWAIPEFYKNLMPQEYATLPPRQKLEALYQAGLVEIRPGAAWPTMVRFLDERDGDPVQDIWAYQPYTDGTVFGTNAGIDADVAWMGPTAPERLGYRTQKPEGLLWRILAAGTQKGATVLDPFCGCGTAVIAAQELERRWIGIDVTYIAIGLVEDRLKGRFGDEVKGTYKIEGAPTDVASARALWNRNRKQFELWAIKALADAAPRETDAGVDGLFSVFEGRNESARVVVQVKGGHSLAPSMIRDLIGTVDSERAAMGLFITLEEPTAGMRENAIHAGIYISPLSQRAYPRIQIRTVEELMAGNSFDVPEGESPTRKARFRQSRAYMRRML